MKKAGQGLCLLVLVGLSGCGTMGDALFGDAHCGVAIPGEFRVYGGVRSDVEAIGVTGYSHRYGEGGWCWAIDLPFSLVTDTALLPFTALNALLCTSKPPPAK